MDVIGKPFRPEAARRRVDSVVEPYAHRFEPERVAREQTAHIREQVKQISNLSVMHDTGKAALSIPRSLPPSPRMLFPEKHEQLAEKRQSLSWAAPELEMDLRLPLPDGSRSWFHLTLHLLLDRKDRIRELGYVGRLTNINRIKSEATEWQRRADTDVLTQLCNRAEAHVLFEELLREGRDGAVPLTLAFMDIGH